MEGLQIIERSINGNKKSNQLKARKKVDKNLGQSHMAEPKDVVNMSEIDQHDNKT